MLGFYATYGFFGKGKTRSKYKDGFDYCKKTGKVPVCECQDFLNNDDCVHIQNMKKEIYKKFNFK